MKTINLSLIIIFSFIFVLNSCTDDSTGLKEKQVYSAPEKSISGKLVIREYNTEEAQYQMKDWALDTGSIIVLSQLDEEVGRGTVDKNGNFVMLLTGKISETSVSNYTNTENGVTSTPTFFKCNLVPMKIQFHGKENTYPTAINCVVLDESNTYPIETYGFFFCTEVATISGTAHSTGDVYNINYSFGWNIRKEFKEDGFHKTYINVDDYPSNIVWYVDNLQ